MGLISFVKNAGAKIFGGSEAKPAPADQLHKELEKHGLDASNVKITVDGDKVHVTGLGLPSEMRDFIKDGTVKAFQLWSPYNEGWLSVYFAKGVLDKTVKNEVGASFDVPNLGKTTINKGNSINTQASLTTFDAKNIDEFHF